MHKETEDLIVIQNNCLDFLRIAVEKMNKKPIKFSNPLKDIYMNQFILINEQTLRGIYNDRQRIIRKVSKRKTTC